MKRKYSFRRAARWEKKKKLNMNGIIDFHTHTFPDHMAAKTVDHLKSFSHTPAYTDGTNAGLLRKMKEAGIERSVILPVATKPSQVKTINRTAAEVNRQYKENGLISFAGMHPDYEDWEEEMHRIKENGIAGIKIHPVYQGVDIDDTRFIRILKCAKELDLIVVTHAGKDIGLPGIEHCSPAMCRNALDQTGPFKFVLAHMGGWKNWDEVPHYFKGTGVYVDTSFSADHFERADDYWSEEDSRMLSAEGYMKIIREIGAEHVLFGTDSPWGEQKKTVNFIDNLPLSNDEKTIIFRHNAERLIFADKHA